MSRGYTPRHAQTAGDLSFAVQFNDEMSDIQAERMLRHKLSGQTEQSKVNQHVPTSSDGRHNHLRRHITICTYKLFWRFGTDMKLDTKPENPAQSIAAFISPTMKSIFF